MDDLKALPTTKSVLSYSTIAGSALPHELADESQIKQLLNNGWSRIVLTSNIPDESKSAFDLVTTVRNICQEHYGDNYKLAGNAVSYSDIKSVTTTDSTTVKMASILAIGAVLLVMFRSISIPIILVSAIEVSIWINEAVPYFTGDTINFVAFLVIDAVQLGAAVDYAIIFTEEYLARRKRMNKKDSAFQSVEKTAQPIITSSSILILACIGITVAVSSPMIQQVGELIARGAFISVVEIFFVLPLLFQLLDGFVRHTSYKIGFYQEGKGSSGTDGGSGAGSLPDSPTTTPAPSGGQDTHRPRDGHRPPQTFGVNSNDHQEQEARCREERPLAWAQGPRGDCGHAHGLYDVRAVWRHAGAGRRGKWPVHRAGL